MSYAIAGKTAVVTGAANGVGLAIARHLADHDANVMFADMDEKRLVEELGDAKEDGNIRYFGGDLREKLTIANLLSATIDAFDRVDILVNGSRQMLAADPLNPDDDAVIQLINQNLMTSLRLTQLFSKRMILQAKEDGTGDTPAGSIVNLSSIAARRTQPELMAYSISSAALDQMTRSMAVALAPHQIRVNAVAFGSVMSASLKNAIKEDGDMRDKIVDKTPLSRIAGPGELGDTVQFLASDASRFMTGQVLTVDGGRTLVDVVEAPAH